VKGEDGENRSQSKRGKLGLRDKKTSMEVRKETVKKKGDPKKKRENEKITSINTVELVGERAHGGERDEARCGLKNQRKHGQKDKIIVLRRKKQKRKSTRKKSLKFFQYNAPKLASTTKSL